MADMLTVTVGTTDYTFDWIDQHIHIEAGVTEVSASDLKLAIHDAQDDPVGMPFPPIADFFNPVTLTPTTDTFLNVVLRDQWRIESFSSSGELVVGQGNVVNFNFGIAIFVPNVLVNMVNNTSQAGVFVSGEGGGTVDGSPCVQEYEVLLLEDPLFVTYYGDNSRILVDEDDTRVRIDDFSRVLLDESINEVRISC